MSINRKWFFDSVRPTIFKGSVSQAQVDGMNVLLSRADEAKIDYREFAYILATTWWETAQTMQPIAEYGKGKGHTYGKPAGPYGQTYYGRGFVQITWYDNYVKLQKACGARWGGRDQVQQADLALDPDIACDNIFYGMTAGMFTGKSLATYITLDKTDWYNARKIVNPNDTKSYQPIATAAAHFHDALTFTPGAAAETVPT